MVATGGTNVRAADNTVQPGGTMQLVTPFVTTSQNNLKVSPLTDIAANAMASNVKKGATLANGFSAGMRTMLSLDSANIFMLSDTTVYLNVLKGAIKSDNMYYNAQSLQSSELLNGLDYLGVMLDLPTKDVIRVVGANQAPCAIRHRNGVVAGLRDCARKVPVDRAGRDPCAWREHPPGDDRADHDDRRPEKAGGDQHVADHRQHQPGRTQAGNHGDGGGGAVRGQAGLGRKRNHATRLPLFEG